MYTIRLIATREYLRQGASGEDCYTDDLGQAEIFEDRLQAALVRMKTEEVIRVHKDEDGGLCVE